MDTWVIITLSAAALLILILLGCVLHLTQQNSRMLKRNADISAKNTSLEMHKLKYSLNAHTLKNVLECLQTTAQNISTSIDSLSKILDYMFQNGENHLVSIKKEVSFVKNYIKNQQVFSNEPNNIKLNVDGLDTESTKYSQDLIPHLITAYLMENAFKHGHNDHPEFLQITIISNNDHFKIEVLNKIKPNKKSTEKGTGLSNMKQRLKILKEGKYKYSKTKNKTEYLAILTIDL